MNKQVFESFAQFLIKGPNVKNSNYHGFTRAQLEKMGVEKSFLKKAVRSGHVEEMMVNESKHGGFQKFYYVEKKEFTPVPEGTQVEVKSNLDVKVGTERIECEGERLGTQEYKEGDTHVQA